ncbi:hypothetical protein BK140_21330 [Paenibacillus macerans]|nr:hypothetical protein BK140_21330 [Paenibacillus macerans]
MVIVLFFYVKDCSGYICMPDIIWFLYMYYNNVSIIGLRTEAEHYYVVMLLINFIPSFMYLLGLSMKRFYINFKKQING